MEQPLLIFSRGNSSPPKMKRGNLLRGRRPLPLRVTEEVFNFIITNKGDRRLYKIPGHFKHMPNKSAEEALFYMNQSERVISAYQDMQQCLDFIKGTHHHQGFTEFKDISLDCLDCWAYCSLFPKGYQIDKDTLTQLWIAAGLINHEPMEDIANGYVFALCKKQFISFFRHDHGVGKEWYKVNEFDERSEKFLQTSRIRLFKDKGDHPLSVQYNDTEPCHVSFRSHLPRNGLEELGRFSQLRAILLLSENKSIIKSIPYDFFISLERLQTLDLSGTRVSELPDSVAHAKFLQYLDLSETLIKKLPETIDCLHSLQTLKLRNCPRLISLPKGMRKLITLRHLDVGTRSHLYSMPPGIGALTLLRTLTEFVVSSEPDGCSNIGELKNMNKLTGKFCLSGLEHVAGAVEAKDGNLSFKWRLNKLELRWTDEEQRESSGADNEVIEGLQPDKHLQELRIVCFGGSRLPNWIGEPSFVKLVSITLFKCQNCLVLPSLGQLHSLESLSLIELTSVKLMDFCFCEDGASVHENEVVAFPKLQKLVIKSMVNLEVWKDAGKKDFPSLTKLSIKNCPELAALCRLSNMNSLEFLEINHCSRLHCLPQGELPASVEMIVIESCPSLKLGSLENDHHWEKKQHGPSSFIYQRYPMLTLARRSRIAKVRRRLEGRIEGM